MPQFRYTARDSRGTAQDGTIQAANRTLAAHQLRDRGWVVLALENFVPPAVSGGSLSLGQWLPPRSANVELSLQQLSMMIRSGMTLLASINALVLQTTQRSLVRVWEDVGSRIQRGSGLGQAMQRHRCFPEFVLRLVRVGEQTGNMESVLTRAASTMRGRRVSRDAFVSATIYPVLVVVLAGFVTVYMVAYLIPRLEIYLQSLGREMPAMTKSLIEGSTWLRGNLTAILLVAACGVTAVAAVTFSRDGRFWLDRIVLRVPVIGRLISLSETATFGRGLSMMLKSGITLTEGLGAVERVLNNRFLRSTVAQARERIIRGSSFADALNHRHAFTPMLGQMIAVGQQSGDLDRVLEEVAEMHDTQFQSYVRRLNAILTPALTLVIGGIVGYVYIAFFVALIAAGS